jgi:hypothetical protein
MMQHCRSIVLAIFLLGLSSGWFAGWSRGAAAQGDAAAAHRIVHKRPPLRWEDGFPLGNGDIGVMMWGAGEPLAITLDKADLWDLRANTDYLSQPQCNYASLVRLVAEKRFSEVDEVFEKRQSRDNPVGPTKISIGRAELRLGTAIRYECGLDLGTATVAGSIETKTTRHQVQAFIHRAKNVFCLRVTPSPREAELRLIPLAEMNATLAKLNHPRPQLQTDGGLRVWLQSIPDGPAYAVAWNSTGPDFFLAIESASPAAEAVIRTTPRIAIRMSPPSLDVRQFVTFSPRPDHRRVVVRLLIIDELLRYGVERQLSFDFPGNDAEMTKEAVVMGDFHGRDRVLSAPDAIEPVLDVA